MSTLVSWIFLLILAIPFVVCKAGSHPKYSDAMQKTKKVYEQTTSQDSQPRRERLVGRHVCTENKITPRTVRHMESYFRPVYKTYSQVCGHDRAKMCTTARVVYEHAFRTVYKTTPSTEIVQTCCPGWTQSSPSERDCTKAICVKECKNGGSCIKPDYCSCPKGWTEPTCETDVDECKTGKAKCEHKCINTPGSYKCGCHEGFTLKNNKRNCRLNLKSIPEYNEVKKEYQELAAKINKLEKDHNLTALENTVEKLVVTVTALKDQMADHPGPEKNSYEAQGFSTGYGSSIEYINSLSDQISMLEERLGNCLCDQSGSHHKYKRSKRQPDS